MKYCFCKKYNIYKSYLIGTLLSIILTVIPFAIVISNFLNIGIKVILITSCAMMQIIVHLIYFLHLNCKVKQRYNLIALLFTILIISILMFGTWWIMLHLKHNLMYY